MSQAQDNGLAAIVNLPMRLLLPNCGHSPKAGSGDILVDAHKVSKSCALRALGSVCVKAVFVIEALL